jgi:hypothetical protein
MTKGICEKAEAGGNYGNYGCSFKTVEASGGHHLGFIRHDGRFAGSGREIPGVTVSYRHLLFLFLNFDFGFLNENHTFRLAWQHLVRVALRVAGGWLLCGFNTCMGVRKVSEANGRYWKARKISGVEWEWGKGKNGILGWFWLLGD